MHSQGALHYSDTMLALQDLSGEGGNEDVRETILKVHYMPPLLCWHYRVLSIGGGNEDVIRKTMLSILTVEL